MMRVFDVPAIAQFYFTTDGDSQHIKAYIRMLDYLHFLILEYLRSYQSLQQESGQVKYSRLQVYELQFVRRVLMLD